MARIIDYQFDSFGRDSQGNRIIKNSGSAGSANDAIMHTGRGLYFDGADDRIVTDWAPDQTFKSFIAYVDINPDSGSYATNGLKKTSSTSGNNFCFGLQTSDACRIGIADGWATKAGPIDSIMHGATYDGATAKAYYDGDLFESNSISDSMSGNGNVCIGTLYWWESDAYSSYYVEQTFSSWIVLDVVATDDDMQNAYLYPEKLINMVVTGVDDALFSFSHSNIIRALIMTHHSGNTVTDVVTGSSFDMINFPADDTQWTNGDEHPSLPQMCLFRKGPDGLPSAPADPHTIRFD